MFRVVFVAVSVRGIAVGLKNALQLGMLFWIFGLVLIAIFRMSQRASYSCAQYHVISENIF